MDNGKPPDTNVVRLRRNGDPSDEERQRLASTIFAEQDEVGTFSRGNLVPPAPTTPPARNEPPPADPFFEKLQAPLSSGQTETAAIAGERSATAAYFERLGSQTPAEMSETVAPQPGPATMLGSANLPRELVTPRRRRFRGRHAIASSRRRTLSIVRVRVAVAPVVAAFGALLVAGAALAAIVGGDGHRNPAANRLATKQTSAASSHVAAPTIPANLQAALARSSARYHSARRQAPHRVRRHRSPKVHVVLAADHRATRGGSSSSATVTPVDRTSSQTTQSSQVIQQPANPSPVAETASGSGSSTSSTASRRPAFGANGTLAPGHSPTG